MAEDAVHQRPSLRRPAIHFTTTALPTAYTCAQDIEACIMTIAFQHFDWKEKVARHVKYLTYHSHCRLPLRALHTPASFLPLSCTTDIAQYLRD